MIIFYNGMFINENEKEILPHFFDSMQGFFTTLKFANNKIYHLDLHIKRLKKTAEYLNFDFPEHNFEYIIRHLILVNNFKQARIRIVCYNPWSPKCFVSASKIEEYKKKLSLKSKVISRNSQDYKFKMLNNLLNVRFIEEAQTKGYDDFIFIDEQGFVLETTFANIFFIYDNRIFTPPSFHPIVPGIIREILLKNKLINDYRFIEKKIHYSEIKNFEEAFITNSIKGIVPINLIDNFSYITKKVSSISKKADL